MSDQTKSDTENVSTADAVTVENEAEVPTPGENVLTLLRRATELAGGNSRYAVDIAKRMSDQLWPLQKRVVELEARVAELEAEVQLYRDKSENLQRNPAAGSWGIQLDGENACRVIDTSPCTSLIVIKSELVLRLAGQNPHLFQRDVGKVVDVVLDEIVVALARGSSYPCMRPRGTPTD